MRLIANFISIFLFLVSTVYAQSSNQKVNDIVWGVNTSHISNGKIVVLDIDAHYFVPFSFRVEKWAGKTDIEMEGHFILDIGGGTENVLSSTFTFNDLDFGSSILTPEKTGNLGFSRNLSRIGTVKFKFREKLNGTWQPYRYATKTQETIYAPRPDITIDGPDHICSTGSYSIGNAQYIPSGITLENATGIASLTDNNNGTFSISQIGNSTGIIKIKVLYDNRYFTKSVIIGNPVTIVGPTAPVYAQKGAGIQDVWFSVAPHQPGTTYEWEVTGTNRVIFPNGNTTTGLGITIHVLSHDNMGTAPFPCVMKVKATNSCGTTTATYNFSIVPAQPGGGSGHL